MSTLAPYPERRWWGGIAEVDEDSRFFEIGDLDNR